jgi:protein LTV1
MDDFLQNYEVSGGKMKPSLPGSGAEKLQSLRLAMGRGKRVTVEDSDQEGKEDDIYAVIEDNEKQERWDVETVLSKSYFTRDNPSLIVFQSNVHKPRKPPAVDQGSRKTNGVEDSVRSKNGNSLHRK